MSQEDHTIWKAELPPEQLRYVADLIFDYIEQHIPYRVRVTNLTYEKFDDLPGSFTPICLIPRLNNELWYVNLGKDHNTSYKIDQDTLWFVMGVTSYYRGIYVLLDRLPYYIANKIHKYCDHVDSREPSVFVDVIYRKKDDGKLYSSNMFTSSFVYAKRQVNYELLKLFYYLMERDIIPAHKITVDDILRFCIEYSSGNEGE